MFVFVIGHLYFVRMTVIYIFSEKGYVFAFPYFLTWTKLYEEHPWCLSFTS